MRYLISQISVVLLFFSFFSGIYCHGSTTTGKHPLDKQYRVLFVPSYNLSYGLTNNLSAGLISYFSTCTTPITLEYMEIDVLLHPKQGEERFKTILNHISEEKFDLIICGGAPAYNLFADNIDRLPTGLPVVFFGYFNFNEELRQLHPELTGIKLQYDLDGTIDMGLKMLPETKSVYIINDFSSGNAELASRLKHKYRDLGVNIVYLTPNKYSTAQMLSKISAMPEKSFLLFANWNRDENQVVVRIHNLLNKIIDICPKPIFTVNEKVLNYCALGGVVAQSERHGVAVGHLVEKILTGVTSPSSPVQISDTEKIVYFDRQRKYGLSLKPGQLEVQWRNIPKGIFISPYEWAAIIIGAIMILALMAYLTLMWNNWRLRRNWGNYFNFALASRKELLILLQTVLENIPCAVFVKNYSNDGRYILTNRYFKEIYHTTKEPCGLNDYELFDFEDAERFRQDDNNIISGSENNVKSSGFYRDGERFYQKNRKVMLQNKMGHKLILGISLDITALTVSQNKLLRSNLLLQAIMNNMPAYIFGRYADDGKRYVIWNHNMELLTGIKADDVLDKTESEVNNIIPIYPGQKPYECEVQNRQNEPIQLSVINKEIILDNAQSMVLTMAIDISQTKAAERAKSYFLATISHELRTPLNAVIGFSDLLQKSNISDPEIAGYINALSSSSRALLALVNDVLDLSKLEANKMTINMAENDLRVLGSEMSNIFSGQTQLRGTNLIIEYPEPMPNFYFDAGAMRHILLNIIGNAVNFTEQGSIKVQISYTPHENKFCTLIISVSDHGIGIPETDQENIFDPFFQAANTVRGAMHFGGTGLGLPIAKRLVEKMGGDISFVSVLKQGTTFKIIFPMMRYNFESDEAADSAKKNQAAANMVSLPKRLILIVDDVPLNLAVLGATLKKLGMDVVIANSGNEGLKILQQRSDIQVIFTDIWMPGLSGVEFAAAVKDLPQYKNTPIFALTADSEATTTFNTINFVKILVKPLNMDMLRKILGSL